ALRPVHLHVPDPDALDPGVVRGAADPARPEPAGRPGPPGAGGGPPPGRPAEGGHRIPDARDRRAAGRGRRGRHPRLPARGTEPTRRGAGPRRTARPAAADGSPAGRRAARRARRRRGRQRPAGVAVDGDRDSTRIAINDTDRGRRPRRSMGAMAAPAQTLEAAVQAALATVHDPEIRRPITDLGMVESVTVSDDGMARVSILLTIAGCPLRDKLRTDITQAVGAVSGVTGVEI